MKYALTLLPLLLLLGLAGCKSEYEGQEVTAEDPQAPIPVRLVSVVPTTDPIPIEAGGTVSAKDEARLSFKIGGIIASVLADEGDYVRSGQVLARLKRTEIDAQVNKAQQVRDKAERDLERIESLYADSATTLENVENLRTQLEVSEADLVTARFNQEYATIVAPFSGRITRKMAERGELIGGGQPVFLISGEGRRAYVIRVGVADRQLLSLQAGDRAEVALDAYPGEIISASVTALAAAADPRTGTFAVELTLKSDQRTIRNGFIGRVKIFPSQTGAYVKLPMNALVDAQGRSGKVVIPSKEGDRVSFRTITIRDFLDDAFTVPAAQLTEVEQVVGAGAAYLGPNSTITIQ